MVCSRANFTFTILPTSYHFAKALIHSYPYRDRLKQTAHYRLQTHLMATAQRNKGTIVLSSETFKTALLQIQFHGMWCHVTGLEFSGTLNEACPFILRGGGVQKEFNSFWTPWPKSHPRRPEFSGPVISSHSELVVYVMLSFLPSELQELVPLWCCYGQQPADGGHSWVWYYSQDLMLYMVLDVVKYLHQICQNCNPVTMWRGTHHKFITATTANII
jgi:hypothetical protein